ncbi:polysaccharide deacetylase family protein [Pseudogracilibacillus auburnensis]|uniref:polysaccharide deacetylase family protein n=1 Tax=Pseudogracilibacillus auburnensis TaxID=1494959 RepID=UPI001A962078|nr:polysaccharide deacetylase family protein [Pseudogracilibacillus auburnensis]MBO1005098.1 polysaccharide deacetylase family protein [Pseudogracilibacillus auburnensis]
MKPFVLSIGMLFIFFPNMFDSFEVNKGRDFYESTGNVIWDIPTEEKLIALTFDDGPHPIYTPQVLNILREHGAKATFFVVGENAKKFPGLIERESAEGHEIGNHTYTHPYEFTPEQLQDELIRTDEVIYNITGNYPSYYRPVGGSYDDMIVSTAVHSGFRVVLWSWHQDTGDWKRPGVDKIVNKVVSGARPGDVVLFHDAGGNRSQTVAALKKIIPALKEEGFTFVTISELLERNAIEVTE